MTRKLIYLLLLVCFSRTASAQQWQNSAEIFQSLNRLNVLGSVLYVAAHPDDENTRLLAFFARERLYRTGYLSITRGDGGQNLIGNEQGVELGLIRTQELLAARRIDGAEQFFTRAFDFGYSKEPGETLEKWNREKILGDVVWMIRKFQPDVIITRFPVTGEGGHGHHTASAILANEAFTAAADPKKFPEQLKFVSTWQAKRIAWNSFNFNNTATPAGALTMEVGAYNSLLGKSYGEIASESRSQHKSQGFGVARTRGAATENFQITGGTKPASDLFEDVVTDWKRITGGPQVQNLIEAAISQYDFRAPHQSVPALVRIRQEMLKLPNGYWKEQKLKEIGLLIEQAAGLWLDAFTGQPGAAQGDTARISFSVNNRTGLNIVLKSVSMTGFDTLINKTTRGNTNENFTKTIRLAADHPITQPYWLELPMVEGSFNVRDPLKIGQPDADAAFTVRYTLSIEGTDMVFEKPVRYKYTDPVRGELYQPFIVMPPVTLEVPGQVRILVPGQSWVQELGFTTHRSMDKLEVLENGSSLFSRKGLSKGMHDNFRNAFDIVSPAGSDAFTREYQLEGGRPLYSFRTIDYDHIPTINYFSPAVERNLLLPVVTKGKKIGYITGAGDKVPEALAMMGYEVVLLGDKELSKNHLAQYDAIISGVRAYNTNVWLNNHYEKLMEYVRDGGNLIVQYNTSNQIGPVRARIGPYPFNISRTRVSVETAPVEMTDPAHPVFNFPNRITSADFNNWVQERSIYHATGFDSSFKSLISMNDPGEQPDGGSLIVSRYGKGYFTYTGLVFFRQLPAGVPGAIRLMANLIALNQQGK